MTLYTPPSLPRTPASLQMTATLPPLPLELLSTWSSWRPPKSQTPLTPPLSTAPQRRAISPPARTHTTLPPIAHLDRQLARLSPVTPPQADDTYQWHSCGSASLRLPPVVAPSAPSYDYFSMQQGDAQMKTEFELSSPPPEQALDWLTPSTHRSSRFLAEKTCEMVCYLWFSPLSQSSSPSKRTRSSNETSPLLPPVSSATASLQFAVSPAFTRFMTKLLETTQVSQSVIVLSLHYIYRLKLHNVFTNGQSGSEYRVAVAALMMANKFVDDNTYTNKTWSEVSGIELAEINRMEREFLLGIDFGLYVDKSTYDSWLNLLKGLVLAKERASRHWQRSRFRGRAALLPKPHLSPPRLPHHPPKMRSGSYRARSSSPSRTRSVYPFTGPSPCHVPSAYAKHAVSPCPGAKRSATDAFSPTSASFPPIKPTKRATRPELDIPQTLSSSTTSISPLEPLQSFAKLSLGSSPAHARNTSHVQSSPAWSSSPKQAINPQTLVSAYRMDDKRPYAAPQNLYFYSLACSPAEEEKLSRKGRLRYHQPPVSSSSVYGYSSQPSIPMVVQSACASPHEGHAALPPLPHIPESVWGRPTASVLAPPPYQRPSPIRESVPSAPFANAGPPGIHFYHNNESQRSSPEYYWVRGRQQ